MAKVGSFTALFIKEKLSFNDEDWYNFVKNNQFLAIYIPRIQQLVLEEATIEIVCAFLNPMDDDTRKGCVIMGYIMERNQDLKDLRTAKIAEEVFKKEMEKVAQFEKLQSRTMQKPALTKEKTR